MGLPCVRIKACIREKPWLSTYGGCVLSREKSDCKYQLVPWKGLDHTKATDSRAMGLAAPWYRRGGTSMESLIPCSHGGRALVVKGAEEVENAEANSKYQDRVVGQRPRNFIRPVSMDFSSR
ncbi:hypothetical protein B296_00003209 [Ensete ventricosum]|uniref:Uncharacterized protein n=1 Tax=Ensete ventricosum TaxID=4639 RepID=A0A426Z915_ENSVE|nr:hypothetical protein B296_00003209 [Ensete ventricosum]